MQIGKTQQNAGEVMQSSGKATQSGEGFGDLLELLMGLTEGSQETQGLLTTDAANGQLLELPDEKAEASGEQEAQMACLYLLGHLPVNAVSGEVGSGLGDQAVGMEVRAQQGEEQPFLVPLEGDSPLVTVSIAEPMLPGEIALQEINPEQPHSTPFQVPGKIESQLSQQQPTEPKLLDQLDPSTEPSLVSPNHSTVQETTQKQGAIPVTNGYALYTEKFQNVATPNSDLPMGKSTEPIAQQPVVGATPSELPLANPSGAEKQGILPQDFIELQLSQRLQPTVQRMASQSVDMVVEEQPVLDHPGEVADSSESMEPLLSVTKPVVLQDQQGKQGDNQQGAFQAPTQENGVTMKGFDKPVAQEAEFTLQQDPTQQSTALPERTNLIPMKELPVGQVPSRLMEMVRSMMLQQSHGESTIKMKLQPERLGEVTVKLTWSNGELSAQFITSTGMAKEALESSFPQLRELLAQQNIRLSEAAVFMGQQSGQWGNGTPGQSHQWQYKGQTKQPGNYAEVNLQESVAAAEQKSALEAGVNITV